MSIVDELHRIIDSKNVIRDRLGYMKLLGYVSYALLDVTWKVDDTENGFNDEYVSHYQDGDNINFLYDYSTLGMVTDGGASIIISNFSVSSVYITPEYIADDTEIWVVDPSSYRGDVDYERYHSAYFFYGRDFKEKPSIKFNLPKNTLWIVGLELEINRMDGTRDILSINIRDAAKTSITDCADAISAANVVRSSLIRTIDPGASTIFDVGYYTEGGRVTANPSGDSENLLLYYNMLYVNYDGSDSEPDGGAVNVISALRSENADYYNRLYVDWDSEESGDDGGANNIIGDLKADLIIEEEERMKYQRYLYTDYNHTDYVSAINAGNTGGAYGRIKKYYDMIYEAQGDAIEEMYIDFYDFVGQYDNVYNVPGIYGQLAISIQEASDYKNKLETDYDNTDSVLDGGAVGLMNKYKNYLYTSFNQSDYDAYVSSGNAGGAYGKIMDLNESFNTLKENNDQLQTDYDTLQTVYNYYKYESHGLGNIYVVGMGADDTIKLLDQFLYKEFNQGDYETYIENGGINGVIGGAYGKLKTIEDERDRYRNYLYFSFNQSDCDDWIEAGNTGGAYGEIGRLRSEIATLTEQLDAEKSRSTALFNVINTTITKLENI